MGQVDHENELLEFVNLGYDAVVLAVLERFQFLGGEGFMFIKGFIDDMMMHLRLFLYFLLSGAQVITGRFIGSLPVATVHLDEFIHPLSLNQNSILVVVVLKHFCTFDTAIFVLFNQLPFIDFRSGDLPPDGFFRS